jgi:hypothetical protein
VREAAPPPAISPPEVPEPPEAPAPPPPDVPLAQPEIAFAARAAARPPEPERPLPSTRRAIFFDVENTSRVQHIARVIDYLVVDRLGLRTDFVAVGNWRVIGHDTARLLASHGAQLLHSAPSVGVKDWSDLRIAVAAGVWLGTARPADVLEIISDDRAFDAVGDVATSLGIAFRRLSYRGLTGLPREAVAPPAPVAEPPVESHGGGRRRRGRRGGYARREAPVVHAAPQPAARQAAAAEPHTAPHDELLGAARDLIQASPNGAVTLDTLANALKGRGFSRTSGSPRLITRLRRIRELSVSRSGHITLVDSPAAAPSLAEAPAPEPAPVPAAPPPAAPPPAAPPPAAAPPAAPPPAAPPPAAPPPPTAAPVGDDRTFDERRADVEAALRAGQTIRRPPETSEVASTGAAPDAAQPRHRSRRGGRRRRRHGAPTAG